MLVLLLPIRENVGQGLPQSDFDGSISTFILDNTGRLFAGTFGHGVFRTISSITSLPEKSRQTFHLGENYPNPYAHQTVIPLDIFAQTRVKIENNKS